MTDQAERLRALAREKQKEDIPRLPGSKRVITVASGKGGVGKTNFSVNLSLALKKLGQNVMILDADLGMANIDVICGISPKYNLGHVVNQYKTLNEVIVDFEGVKIVPGISGVENLTSLDIDQQKIFFDELARYESTDNTDVFLIDIGAGMSETVINLMLAGTENIIITTPEPTAMMDAYALIKTLYKRNKGCNVDVVVNMVQSKEESIKVYRSMNMITKQFLGENVNYLGYILSDKVVSKSVRQQKPFFLSYPSSNASKCLKSIAVSISNKSINDSSDVGIKGFFENFSKMLWG